MESFSGDKAVSNGGEFASLFEVTFIANQQLGLKLFPHRIRYVTDNNIERRVRCCQVTASSVNSQIRPNDILIQINDVLLVDDEPLDSGLDKLQTFFNLQVSNIIAAKAPRVIKLFRVLRSTAAADGTNFLQLQKEEISVFEFGLTRRNNTIRKTNDNETTRNFNNSPIKPVKSRNQFVSTVTTASPPKLPPPILLPLPPLLVPPPPTPLPPPPPPPPIHTDPSPVLIESSSSNQQHNSPDIATHSPVPITSETDTPPSTYRQSPFSLTSPLPPTLSQPSTSYVSPIHTGPRYASHSNRSDKSMKRYSMSIKSGAVFSSPRKLSTDIMSDNNNHNYYPEINTGYGSLREISTGYGSVRDIGGGGGGSQGGEMLAMKEQLDKVLVEKVNLEIRLVECEARLQHDREALSEAKRTIEKERRIIQVCNIYSS